MSEIRVTLSLGFRWWVMPYLRLMDHLQRQCGVRIDIAKVHARVLKGTYVVVSGKRVPLAS